MKGQNLSPHVSVIILNWNGWKDTIECLESLFISDYVNYDVILVDNASTDDSLQKIQDYCDNLISVESNFIPSNPYNNPIKISKYKNNGVNLLNLDNIGSNISDLNKKLTLIINDKNYGFSEGNNIAIRYAIDKLETDYIFLLNNDTVISKDSLGKLVRFLDFNEKRGIVGSKIYEYDIESNIIQSSGGYINFNKYPGYFPLNQGFVDVDDINGSMECDWITGAALMIKSDLLPKNLLNTNFFFGCEDIDLCINVKKRGFNINVLLDSKIWHKGRISRKKKFKNISAINHGVKTNLKFLKKNNNYFFLHLPLYLISICLLYIIFFIKSKL